MWAFTLSVMAVYVALKWGLEGKILQLKFVIPELFTLSLLLSLVKKDKWRTALEWVFIILLGLLSTVEVWLSNHFNLPLSCQAIQLLMETNPRESSEFSTDSCFSPTHSDTSLHSFSDWLWRQCCI